MPNLLKYISLHFVAGSYHSFAHYSWTLDDSFFHDPEDWSHMRLATQIFYFIFFIFESSKTQTIGHKMVQQFLLDKHELLQSPKPHNIIKEQRRWWNYLLTNWPNSFMLTISTIKDKSRVKIDVFQQLSLILQCRNNQF